MRYARTVLLLMAALLACPPQASAVEFDLRGGYTFRGYFERNTIDPFLSYLPRQFADKVLDLSSGTFDSNYLLLFAYAQTSLSFADRLSLVANLDTSVLTFNSADDSAGSTSDSAFLFDGFTIGDAARRVAFLREVYAELALGDNMEFMASLGKRRTILLGGFLYDDYGFQAGVDWDFWSEGGCTATASLELLLPDHYWNRVDFDVLVTHASLSLKDFFFQSLHIGLVWVNDRAGLIGDMLRSATATDLLAVQKYDLALLLSAVDYTSKANLYTAYATAEVDLEIVRVSGMFALQWGSGATQLVGGPNEKAVDLEGYMAIAQAAFDLYKGVEVTPFIMTVSGISIPRALNHHYTGFISLVPYVQHASIFFSGGMNQQLTTRDYALVGVGGAGVSAVGLSATFESEKLVEYEQSLTLLSTNRPADSFFSLNYGVEFDNTLTLHFFDALNLVAEIDMLFPGEYLPGDKTILRGIIGVEGTF